MGNCCLHVQGTKRFQIMYKLIFLLSLALVKGQDKDLGCCDSLTLETVGMGHFYQGTRLGKYVLSGQSSSGRGVYSQQGGDNYLFFLVRTNFLKQTLLHYRN